MVTCKSWEGNTMVCIYTDFETFGELEVIDYRVWKTMARTESATASSSQVP